VRQVERYVDLLSHCAATCAWKAGEPLTVADMGCGKGYLTFAAWHLFRRQLNLAARVIGIDAQEGVIESCRAAALRIGAEGLEFQTGTIREVALPALDVLIALHACNDATDHALARGIAQGARLIVVAPCCHKDLRRVLGAAEPLAPLLEHGLFKEHFAEWLTDGLRVLALEAAGYAVTVSEFVAPEHTPKNTLIAGIRGTPPARRQAAAAQYAALKAWAGLGALATDMRTGSAPAASSQSPRPLPSRLTQLEGRVTRGLRTASDTSRLQLQPQPPPPMLRPPAAASRVK
jgi:SAM-dependent methyltransferase